MLLEIFGDALAYKYKRIAVERTGAYSALVGIAANRCCNTGQSARIAGLVTGLPPPKHALTPNRSGPLRIRLP